MCARATISSAAFAARACCTTWPASKAWGIVDKQPARNSGIGGGQHFRIRGVAHHYMRTIAPRSVDGRIDLIEHQQLPASGRQAASEEGADPPISDNHIVILEGRHGDRRSGSDRR